MKFLPARKNAFQAFTLVELLVVIAIIGILIALLLPAIQAAREAARRLECKNHLKQMALGCLTHEQSMRFLPTGGWGWGWIGDPDMGAGKRQPGGWVFNILPYVEMKTLYNMSKGMTGAAKKSALTQMYATPLAMFNCPTRRPVIALPFLVPYTSWPEYDPPKIVGRGDYAMNSGTGGCESYYGPGSLAEGMSPAYNWPSTAGNDDGVGFQRSVIALKEITDGTSHTYLVGEKYAAPDYYATGTDGADNSGLYTGFENDNYRSAYYPPMRDRAGYPCGAGCYFGSVHSVVWNAAFCDGSVRGLGYDLDGAIHQCLANRHDRKTIPGDALK